MTKAAISSCKGIHMHFYRSCWLDCLVNQTRENYFHLQYEQKLPFTFHYQETRQECNKRFHWLLIPFDPLGALHANVLKVQTHKLWLMSPLVTQDWSSPSFPCGSDKGLVLMEPDRERGPRSRQRVPQHSQKPWAGLDENSCLQG